MLASAVNIHQKWNEIKPEFVSTIHQLLDGGIEPILRPRILLLLYCQAYCRCAAPGDIGKKHSVEFYDGYREIISSYVTGKVLPALKEKKDTYLLFEFVKLWKYHCRMVELYCKALQYLVPAFLILFSILCIFSAPIAVFLNLMTELNGLLTRTSVLCVAGLRSWHFSTRKKCNIFQSFQDRFHVAREKLKPLHDLGIGQFTEVVFPAVKNKIHSVLLGLVRKERNGEEVERAVMKDTIEFFIEMVPQDLSTYMSEFEEQFLSETAEFYTRESSRWLDETSPSSCLEEYLNKAEQCLAEERQRVTHYLHASTGPKLMKVCHDILFVHREEQLRKMENFDFDAMIRGSQVEGLKRLYRLFSQFQSGLPPILQTFQQHILSEVHQFVDTYVASEESIQYIQGLICMHDKYLELVDKCFASNNLFQNVLSEVFLLVINKETGKKSTVHQLATYCDKLLKQCIEVCHDSSFVQHEQKRLKMETCDGMVRDNPVEGLKRMYRLFSQFQSGLPPILETFQQHILSEVHQFVDTYVASDESIQYIHGLICMHDKYLELVDKCFAFSNLFHKVLSEAFLLVINKETGKKSTVHQLASYCDTLLKQRGEESTDEKRDRTLSKVVALLRYVQNTDVFEAFYQQDLARRIIFKKSTSTAAEKSMIPKLKNELGVSFSNKLDVMLRDIDLSKDLTSEFKKIAEGIYHVEINVAVLTMGSWPNYRAMDLKLPMQLLDVQESFRHFYLAKHSGRKLSWNYRWSSCILTAHFPTGKKELAASLFQAVITLLFNHAERLTLKDIREQTGIEDRELRRLLPSLTVSKMRILLKQPQALELKDDDIFSINNNFTSQMYRIKLNAIQMKETHEDNQQTNNRVIQDRNCQIDGALVRIMKTRKQLSHNVLVSEASTQLQFPVQPPDLKRSIESLIDREYLARDKGNAHMYIYLP